LQSSSHGVFVAPQQCPEPLTQGDGDRRESHAFVGEIRRFPIDGHKAVRIQSPHEELDLFVELAARAPTAQEADGNDEQRMVQQGVRHDGVTGSPQTITGRQSEREHVAPEGGQCPPHQGMIKVDERDVPAASGDFRIEDQGQYAPLGVMN